MELLSISMIIKGKRPSFICCGITATNARKISARKNVILKTICQFLWAIRLARQHKIKGFSQIILKFHFVCWWSVMKLKNIINPAKTEKMIKKKMSITLFAEGFRTMVVMIMTIINRREKAKNGDSRSLTLLSGVGFFRTSSGFLRIGEILPSSSYISRRQSVFQVKRKEHPVPESCFFFGR